MFLGCEARHTLGETMTYTVPTPAPSAQGTPQLEQVLAWFTLVFATLTILIATVATLGGYGSLSLLQPASYLASIAIQLGILLLLAKGRHRAPRLLVVIAATSTSIATVVSLVMPAQPQLSAASLFPTSGPVPLIVQLLQLVALLSAHAVLIAQYRDVALGWVRPVFWITSVAAGVFGLLAILMLVNPFAMNASSFSTFIVAVAVTLLGTIALMLSRSIAGTAALSATPAIAPPAPPVSSPTLGSGTTQ